MRSFDRERHACGRAGRASDAADVAAHDAGERAHVESRPGAAFDPSAGVGAPAVSAGIGAQLPASEGVGGSRWRSSQRRAVCAAAAAAAAHSGRAALPRRPAQRRAWRRARWASARVLRSWDRPWSWAWFGSGRRRFIGARRVWVIDAVRPPWQASADPVWRPRIAESLLPRCLLTAAAAAGELRAAGLQAASAGGGPPPPVKHR